MYTVGLAHETGTIALTGVSAITLNERDWYSIGLDSAGFYLYTADGMLPTVRIAEVVNVDPMRESITLVVIAPMEWSGLYGRHITLTASYKSR